MFCTIWFFFTFCSHSIFPLKIVGLKRLIKEKKSLKSITCFKKTEPNQKIVLGISFTNWLTSCALEGRGVPCQVKKKKKQKNKNPLISCWGQVWEKEGDCWFTPGKGPPWEWAWVLWCVCCVWKWNGLCRNPQLLHEALWTWVDCH